MKYILSSIIFLLCDITAASSCCPVGPPGKPVVNADQAVILIWDPITRTEHFIRKASFKSEADDFGFLIPTPNQPELNESGDEAFSYIRKITEPVERSKRGAELLSLRPTSVTVLQEKLVAGFHAAVLETTSSAALVKWLEAHGYPFSPEIQAWAEPYIDLGWKITAFKIAKEESRKTDKNVATAALRMTFKTDQPLFPYREPASNVSAPALGAVQRILRIYFISDAIYDGEFTKGYSWTGKVAWANELSSDNRHTILNYLKLSDDSGPKKWWLTEFEDEWPYKVAPSDLYFKKNKDQRTIQR